MSTKFASIANIQAGQVVSVSFKNDWNNQEESFQCTVIGKGKWLVVRKNENNEDISLASLDDLGYLQAVHTYAIALIEDLKGLLKTHGFTDKEADEVFVRISK